ncbi:ribosomal protein L24E [Ophiocordyceps camponoti-floridani]|uniref:Ribosomal protein L24E n=1 Tax=Ophiocordyceps camponoti-floridani TaxID=2030778 RepID=A0A8H4VGN7_9HYPO|nr:ribosomal protein L24E [Ophiocordyceps camponoti-floridani]
MSHMAPRAGVAIPARSHSRSMADEPEGLFPDIAEAKKRKFILVEDNVRGSRLRVRVTLDGVDTNEIPDSFRKGASVYPRSYFPREMQSPPPSATGSRFFADDLSDDGIQETEGRDASHHRAPKPIGEVVKVALAEGHEGEATIPRTRQSRRGKEVRLNDLAYRMAWLQSRVFAGRTVFLQRALDCYRNKTRAAIEGTMRDVATVAPFYETRAGKRKWTDRRRRGEEGDD